MNFLDFILILLIVSAYLRGREMGLVRQVCSTAGFFSGLFLGSYLQHFTVGLVATSASKSLVATATTLGCALIVFAIGEYVGAISKHKVQHWSIDKVDNSFGSLLGVISFLIVVWLSAAILVSVPSPHVQAAVEDSTIITHLNILLPSAPKVIADFGKLISPNGFPQVFSGREPALPSHYSPTPVGSFQAVIDSDRASVVKIEGKGCGGIVEGSGFVVAPGLVVTNAHVVAGINRPYVKDARGTHSGLPILFDPDLDLAILEVKNLAGKPLLLDTSIQAPQTQAVALGYPGGGDFTAEPATLLEQFTAEGRNIYDSRPTSRDVYALHAAIIPGNSGGPLIANTGDVIGVVFAQSTTYKNTGYALTMTAVSQAIQSARIHNQVVTTRACAE